jgi:hypothetical protein
MAKERKNGHCQLAASVKTFTSVGDVSGVSMVSFGDCTIKRMNFRAINKSIGSKGCYHENHTKIISVQEGECMVYWYNLDQNGDKIEKEMKSQKLTRNKVLEIPPYNAYRFSVSKDKEALIIIFSYGPRIKQKDEDRKEFFFPFTEED